MQHLRTRLTWRDAVALTLAAVLVLAGIAGASMQRADAASPGVDTVYIANGITFADALTGGPNASLNGSPLLLVVDNALPLETRTELERLAPGEIVILGGTVAVSAAVEAELAALTNPAGNVRRIAGANRFETAAKLAQELPDHIDADTLAGRIADDYLTIDDDVLTSADAADFAPASAAESFAIGLSHGEEALIGEHGPVSYWVRCLDNAPNTAVAVVARSAVDDWYVDLSSPVNDANVGTPQENDFEVHTSTSSSPTIAFDTNGVSVIGAQGGEVYRISLQLETSPSVVNDFGYDCVQFGTVFRSSLALGQ